MLNLDEQKSELLWTIVKGGTGDGAYSASILETFLTEAFSDSYKEGIEEGSSCGDCADLDEALTDLLRDGIDTQGWGAHYAGFIKKVSSTPKQFENALVSSYLRDSIVPSQKLIEIFIEGVRNTIEAYADDEELSPESIRATIEAVVDACCETAYNFGWHSGYDQDLAFAYWALVKAVRFLQSGVEGPELRQTEEKQYRDKTPLSMARFVLRGERPEA
jgi:hypothetical protein